MFPQAHRSACALSPSSTKPALKLARGHVLFVIRQCFIATHGVEPVSGKCVPTALATTTKNNVLGPDKGAIAALDMRHVSLDMCKRMVV